MFNNEQSNVRKRTLYFYHINHKRLIVSNIAFSYFLARALNKGITNI